MRYRLLRSRTLALLGAVVVVLAACGGEQRAGLSPAERVQRLQDLLVRGVAHAEIGEWPQALELFAQARTLDDSEPVIAFNLAVASFGGGDADGAAQWLERIGDDAPASLRARAEHLRGRLALERGDAVGEAAAYRRAGTIDPDEPAYPYALSQVVPRLGEGDGDKDVGELLERAADLWPENSRIAAELAQWQLGRRNADEVARGVDIVVRLAGRNPDVEPFVERGLEELEADPTRAPVSLRRALNLLRPGKRFQTDSSALEARLALLPLADPSNEILRQVLAPLRVEVTFEAADLLPDAPFADGEPPGEVIWSNDAVGDAGATVRDADLWLAAGTRLRRLGRDGSGFETVADIGGAQGRVVVLEIDGDGLMEVVIFGSDGVSLVGRSEDGNWSQRPLAERFAGMKNLVEIVPVDFEHDGDLDLLAVDGTGQLFLVTHRGESGLGEPVPAPLEVDVPVHLVRAIDLDADADQDLLVVQEDSVQVLVNVRQGEFVRGGRLETRGPLRRLLATDYTGDGLFDLVGLASGGLRLWHNRSVGGPVADVDSEDEIRRLVEGELVEVVAADIDLDGDEDLLLAETGGVHSVVNGGGGFAAGARIETGLERITGLSAADLDGDLDPDLLVWDETGLETFRATGAESQGWLQIALRGLAGKVPLDGRGSRVGVSFGLDRRVFELQRPEIVLGLGGRNPSLVEVIWPNGISEFLFEPSANERHLIEQVLRIEGSCPFLYASDGAEVRFVTDILGLAPLGMRSGTKGYVVPDPEEYLRLPDWVSAEGSVELQITEELREVAYIDQLELVVVDAPADIEVYNGERWIEGWIEGLDLRLLGPLSRPAAVTADDGSDVLAVVAELDGRYLTNFAGDRLYQGAAPEHRIEVSLPRRIAATGGAALVMNGWLHWGNTSVNVARAQDPRGGQVFPYLEVPTGAGGWRRVEIDVGLPAGKTKPVVVDLTGVVDAADPRVRITTDFEVYWDRIAVAEAMPVSGVDHVIHRLTPESAELSYGGFSRWYREAENGPFLFDYGERRPFPWRHNESGSRPIAWDEHQGFYTEFGQVANLVAEIDDRLVVFGAGEELALSFDTGTLPSVPAGWRRTLFLHSEGWEKDGDPNVACGQTVDPLPRRDMAAYPCEMRDEFDGRATVADPGRTRWVARERLARRVAAWATGDGEMPSGGLEN